MLSSREREGKLRVPTGSNAADGHPLEPYGSTVNDARAEIPCR